ncbi:diaminopimelate epimerase [Candidatus Sneabacter namystus]|uniref:Diaminopimelate epimerase n=1 Tax=Candidatus Sneabacter namystus TaxID=2601646 RepID=A0A5C0UH66_9RICK|nr:diaminopimelate epimerase [Candidatus Sneabacter namystus]QEK39485.1 diaminopimelate epimerase [Candidatus Sneabacter namystus]
MHKFYSIMLLKEQLTLISSKLRHLLPILPALFLCSCTSTDLVNLASGKGLGTVSKIPRPEKIISSVIDKNIAATRQYSMPKEIYEEKLTDEKLFFEQDLKNDDQSKKKIHDNKGKLITLSWPIKGKVVNKFKETVNGKSISGIHISAKKNQEVYCALQGKVTYVGPHSQFGKTIIIRSENGIKIAYAYLSKTFPKLGDQVKQKQLLGLACGTKEHPVLYFAMQKGTISVNPMQYLERINYMPKEVPFVKMHGLGNDFVIVEDKFFNYQNAKHEVKLVCDRRLGVGCDQMIVFSKTLPDEYGMVVFNQDGSKGEVCGNATRCLAWLCFQDTGKQNCSIRVLDKVIPCFVSGKDKISVNMGTPKFQAEWMPSSDIMWKLAKNYSLNAREMMCVDMGNPHLVILNQNITENFMSKVGACLSSHHSFPKGVNVNFAKIKNDAIHLKVWERGTGLTLACGSGACATFSAINKMGFVNDEVTVKFAVGDLQLSLQDSNVIMEGPVEKTIEGTFTL